MSLPFRLFNLKISSVMSPVAISVFIHFDLSSVLVNTTFGVSIIFLANACQGSSGLFITSDQKEIKRSVIFRPRRMVSMDSNNSYAYLMCLSSESPTIQSISPLGPAMQPSMDICTCSFNFLKPLLLFTTCGIRSLDFYNCCDLYIKGLKLNGR